MSIHSTMWIIIQYYLLYFGIQIAPAFMFAEKWLILALGQETYPISLETLVPQVNAVRTKPHSDAYVFRGTAWGIVKELPDFQPL